MCGKLCITVSSTFSNPKIMKIIDGSNDIILELIYLEMMLPNIKEITKNRVLVKLRNKIDFFGTLIPDTPIEMPATKKSMDKDTSKLIIDI